MTSKETCRANGCDAEGYLRITTTIAEADTSIEFGNPVCPEPGASVAGRRPGLPHDARLHYQAEEGSGPAERSAMGGGGGVMTESDLLVVLLVGIPVMFLMMLIVQFLTLAMSLPAWLPKANLLAGAGTSLVFAAVAFWMLVSSD